MDHRTVSTTFKKDIKLCKWKINLQQNFTMELTIQVLESFITSLFAYSLIPKVQFFYKVADSISQTDFLIRLQIHIKTQHRSIQMSDN